MRLLFKDFTMVNEGQIKRGSLTVLDHLITEVFTEDDKDYTSKVQKALTEADEVIHGGEDRMLLPGAIDDQVHFREPGSTQKGCIASESAAAVLGGVTSFMDMPNNNPPATTLATLEEKYAIATQTSLANYSFYLGATNENIAQLKAADMRRICGIKVFMGSSTGNMLVDNPEALEAIFSLPDTLIATHCEDEATIKANLAEIYSGGDKVPFSAHPRIRSREACIKSTAKAIGLALKHNTRLHVLHVSTAEEIDMLAEARSRCAGISSEVCVHYMWFDSNDYNRLGAFVKCNPAIKEASDREAIIRAVREARVQAVATDHAPHLLQEKQQDYLHAPSGLPTVQHSLQMMLQLSRRGHFPITTVVEMMCHLPAQTFRISRRGYIRPGYFADLVVVQKKPYTVDKSNIAYRCGWSPLQGTTFDWSITDTFVNGTGVVRNGALTGQRCPARLLFD